MCGIVGIVSKDEDDSVPLLHKMLESIKHRGPDGAGVVASNDVCRGDTLDELDWHNLHGSRAMGHSRLAVVGGSHGQQPFVSDDGTLVLMHNGEIYNYRKLRKQLKSGHNFLTQTDSEVLVHLLSEKYDGDLFKAVSNIVPQLDGVYALAVSDGKDIVIARDLIGVKQLYWVEDDTCFAFASEKKALWSIDLRDEIHRLLPGEIIRFSSKGIERKQRSPEFLRSKEPAIFEIEKALKVYGMALREAVQKRIPDLDKVGMIFSGGIDSVLIAAILKELNANITCYTAGMSECSDIRFAEETAEQLDLPLRVKHLDSNALVELIPKVISYTEDRSLGQVEVAIPILASMEMAHEDGQIVVLTGQGADELFGGYPWYRRIIELDGYNEFENRMWDDLKHLYNETLEREDKISMAYGIELRVPYLDPKVIKAAFSIAPELKIRSTRDTVGKFIHRALASKLGIPDNLAWRPKEAAQHGAGIHYKLLSLAEKRGYSHILAEALGYEVNEFIDEVLGSSQRYGYKYDVKSRWATQDHVQMWLDSLAYEQDLLSPAEREQLEPYLKQAGELIHSNA
jgi:asparagine synthase (glutamine-hydrolysing)